MYVLYNVCTVLTNYSIAHASGLSTLQYFKDGENTSFGRKNRQKSFKN